VKKEEAKPARFDNHVSNLPFALPRRFRIFVAGFRRFSLASADHSAQDRVVETYPLEVPATNLR